MSGECGRGWLGPPTPCTLIPSHSATPAHPRTRTHAQPSKAMLQAGVSPTPTSTQPGTAEEMARPNAGVTRTYDPPRPCRLPGDSEPRVSPGPVAAPSD